MSEPKPYPRRRLLLLALGYLVFVVYGSLVPLEFRSLPLDEAVARFRVITYLDLGISSRADWATNILLFVPLTFLWLGALWHRWNVVARLTASFGVWLAAVALSLDIEFTQLFFPPRTASQNDILAQCTGAMVGIVVWWLFGPRLVRWLEGLRDGAEPWDFIRRVLYVYLAGLLFYNVLPLDLTLSPVELWHKLSEGRLIWIPFTGQPPDLMQALYDLSTDTLIWTPVGFLWWRGACWPTVRKVFLAALLVEFFQLWVYSRITDVTDILTAMLGGWLGAWLASRYRRPRGSAASGPAEPNFTIRILGWAGATMGWFTILGAVFWYPYCFQFERAFLAERVGGLARTPFFAYYYGTEYRAATEVMHKLLFFAPLGMLLQMALRTFERWIPLRGRTLLAVLVIGLMAAVIEGIQLALPGKNADLTDWSIEVIGGLLGALVAARWSSSFRAKRESSELGVPATLVPATRHGMSKEDTRPAVSVAAPMPGALWVQVLALAVVLAGALWVASHLSVVPYNVRELIGGDYPLLSALLLSMALLWIFGFPALAIGRCLARRDGLGCLAGAFVLHGVVAWLMLRVAVPMESLHDIVGSPSLHWPWEWELIGRFLGLFLLWSAAAFGGAMMVLRPRVSAVRAPLLVWSGALPFLLGISYYVAIVQADTDNLTELLADYASLGSFLWLWGAFLVVAIASSMLGLMLGTRFRHAGKWASVFILFSPLLAYLALSRALEPYILKYDQVFSALQFLLSSDRAHYASPEELGLRYVIAYLGVVVIAAASAAPFLECAVLSMREAGQIAPQKNQRTGDVCPDQVTVDG